MNGGGIRGSISIGNITTRDLLSVFPFANNLAVVTLKGKDIKCLLEKSASSIDECGDGDDGAFLQVSGRSHYSIIGNKIKLKSTAFELIVLE